MKVCRICGNELNTPDGVNLCDQCGTDVEFSHELKHKKALARRRQAAREKAEIMESLGLKKVRGALGGTYWE